LIGTIYGYGMFYMDYEKREFSHGQLCKVIHSNVEIIETNRINKVYIDRQNSLWGLTEMNGAWMSHGLILGEKAKGFASFEYTLDYFPFVSDNYNHVSLSGDHYESDHFTDMHNLENNNYLITTKAGELLQMNFETKEVELLFQQNNTFLGIIDHKNEQTFIANSNGFLTYNHVNQSFKEYNKNIGIAHSGNSFFKNSNGDLLLGGVGGFSLVPNWKAVQKKALGNKNYLSKINVMGKNISLNNIDEKLVLEYNKNFVEFFPSRLNFDQVETPKFDYRMKGLNDNWVRTSEAILYNDLSPGEYTLQLKEPNLKEETYSLPILITPPFWQKLWFQLCCLAILVFVGYTYVKLKLTRERKLANLKLETEIAAQESERKRLAQDLHDDFGVRISALKMYINTIENLSQDKDEKLAKLSHSAVDLVDNSMKDLRNLLTNLSPNSLREHGLFAAISELIHSINRVGKIEISFDTNCSNEKFEPSIELNIFRVIQELLNNSVKHARCDSIGIQIILDQGYLRISFSDNGIGFNRNQSKMGYGFTNIENRIKMISGSIKWPNEFSNETNILIPNK